MHPRRPLPTALVRLAMVQDGVVSARQAWSAGMTRHVIARSLRDGTLTGLARGIYVVGSGPPTFEGLAWAGCLVGGEGSRIGGTAAARLHRLADEVPEVVDVVVPRGRTAGRRDPRWRFVEDSGSVRHGSGRGSPPRLDVEDTVLDLCDASERREVVGWVTAAVQRRLTTPRRLRRRVDGRLRLRHRALIVQLLVDVTQGAESPLEVSYLHDVERAHGLPEGSRQGSPQGSPHQTDVDYDPVPLLVELDGRLGHEGMGRFRDMRRDNAHVVLGRPTLRYGHHDVLVSPCAVAEQVAQLLVRLGWNGEPTRCPRCARLDLGAS